MKDFKSFLNAKGSISDKNILFFLHQASQYHAFCKTATQREPERIKALLVALSKRRAEWQVKQAEKAISLYVYYTKGAIARGEDRVRNTFLPSSLDWESVKDKVVRLHRLRHLSYRTDKTYLGWLRRFAEYVSHKSSTDVTQTDLTDYLGYLSVEQKVSASTQRQAFNAHERHSPFSCGNHLRRQGCLGQLIASIPIQPKSGDGSGYFLPIGCLLILPVEK